MTLILLDCALLGALGVLVIAVGRRVEESVRGKVEAEAKLVEKAVFDSARVLAVFDSARVLGEGIDNLASLMTGLANTAQAERSAIMATVQEDLEGVKALRAAVESLIALTDSIKAKLDASGADQATIDAIKSEIDATQAEVNDTLTRDGSAPTPTA